MPYTEGAQGSPADTQDRLSRVGTKYQATPPAVDDGDNVYLLVDSAGRLYIKAQGDVAHDAADSGFPFKMGLKVTTGSPTSVSDGDRVDGYGDAVGRLGVFVGEKGSTRNAKVITTGDGESATNSALVTYGIPGLHAPDGSMDRAAGAMGAAPGLGALNIAPIGGDVTLRASAVAGQASGTSTAVDNLGWVKSFNAHLDVTAAPTGGAPTLDVYLQTQLASGDWQDIGHFTQATAVTAEIVDWGPADGNLSGIGAEGSAVTYDRFFAEQDGALAATTIRVMNLGDSMRVKWVFAAGGSTGDFTFDVTTTPHS